VFKVRYDRNGTTYEHIIPAPVQGGFQFMEERVAKEGSGRNSTGEMFIEYIGSVSQINLKWDILPSTTEYQRLYRILNALPTFFTFIFPHPNGDSQFEMECYNNKINIEGWLFTKKGNYYRGLSTTFTQANATAIPVDEAIL